MTKLVLSRKKREKIMIGDDISVVVLEADRGRAKLMVEAPAEIAVDREEIREQKRASAAGGAAGAVAVQVAPGAGAGPTMPGAGGAP